VSAVAHGSIERDHGAPGAMSGLATINALLADEDDRLNQAFEAPRWPVTLVVSPPRAGSALFQQLALSCTGMDTVSNVLARFWRAPYLGALLERDLKDPNYVSHLKSYGSHYNPVGAHEPHEWGWFWQHWLRLEGDDHYCAPDRPVDAAGLNRKLAAIEAAKEAPLLFDNVFAWCNLDVVVGILPRVLLVVLKRDPYYLCNSILNARADRYGDVRAWHSHRPRNIDDLLSIDDPVAQTVAQVWSILGEIDACVARVDPADVFTVEYPDLVGKPQEVMRRFVAFLAGLGVEVGLRDPLPEFPQLRNRNTPEFVNPLYKELLDGCFGGTFGAEPR